MNAIVIDDEPIAIDVLCRLLSPYKEIKVIKTFTDPSRALKAVRELRPDVIFLDIEMGEINGLEFAERLISELDSVDIVFVTAYSQYAIDAFEVNAIDYLLKPVLKNRLDKTVRRLGLRIKEQFL